MEDKVNIYVLTYKLRCNWDEWDKFVIAAWDEDDAYTCAIEKLIFNHATHHQIKKENWENELISNSSVYHSDQPLIICESFNAG